jgi:hypothetical protein
MLSLILGDQREVQIRFNGARRNLRKSSMSIEERIIAYCNVQSPTPTSERYSSDQHAALLVIARIRYTRVNSQALRRMKRLCTVQSDDYACRNPHWVRVSLQALLWTRKHLAQSQARVRADRVCLIMLNVE